MSRRKGDLAAEVLDSVVNGIDFALDWASNPSEFRRKYFTGQLPTAEWERLTKQMSRRRAIKRLREKKWLAAKVQGEKLAISLHADAFAAVLKERIRQTDRKCAEGTSCLVLFDFPVGARTSAVSWRRFIYSAGFRKDQLSVWKTDKAVGGLMAALVNVLEAQRWIKVYECTEPKSIIWHK